MNRLWGFLLENKGNESSIDLLKHKSSLKENIIQKRSAPLSLLSVKCSCYSEFGTGAVRNLVSHFTQKKSSSEGRENSALAVQSENRGRTSDGRSGGNNKSGSSSKGKGVQCYSCKEFGHVKHDCPLRKNKGKKFDDASSASSLVVADDGDLLTVSEVINTSSRNEWILDSGCTMHVCSKKEFFDTFQGKDGGSLFLGDGTPCEIRGFRNVKIKMFDGAVRALGGVAYVPKLRRNLISLSRMDSIGCKYFARGGTMKITRGGKVLMKGEKCKGLYQLIGKTVYSTKVWKRRAQGNGYPRCDSFAAKTKSCFQVANVCENVNPVGGEDGSRLGGGAVMRGIFTKVEIDGFEGKSLNEMDRNGFVGKEEMGRALKRNLERFAMDFDGEVLGIEVESERR
ncbi:hypothetical protein RHSIM_Rhsim02G0024600 [Rhododendron simsii]|uniref:CCHC-type domain-containing protein n=1 Tax=Rhododendron simsii TaxID=118357 RepID=A0A834HBU8_RHOSS|nr:hypothetical protein RHSIM_Rhsim02G0024600 [Rhododendron simsii]